MSPRNVWEEFLDGMDTVGYETVQLRWRFRQPMEDDLAVCPSVNTTERNV